MSSLCVCARSRVVVAGTFIDMNRTPCSCSRPPLPSTLSLQGDYAVLFRPNRSHNQPLPPLPPLPPVRIVEPYTPDVYHDAKMIDHVPLALFTILLPNMPTDPATAASYSTLSPSPSISTSTSATSTSATSATSTASAPTPTPPTPPTPPVPLSNHTLAILTRYQSLLAANLSLPVRFHPLGAAAVADAEAVVATSRAFLASALHTRALSPAALDAFTRGTLPPLRRNLDRAAKAQIDMLLAVVRRWMAEELTQGTVCVCVCV